MEWGYKSIIEMIQAKRDPRSPQAILDEAKKNIDINYRLQKSREYAARARGEVNE